MRLAKPETKVASWLLQNKSLVLKQKVAVAAAAVFCILSTSVCAWMGGAGGQSLFHTDSNAAYWPFFFLSPILILMLCGRALKRNFVEWSAPSDPYFETIKTPETSWVWRLPKYGAFIVLAAIAGSFNAYNTMQYIPFVYALICVVPSLFVPGIVMVPAFLEYHRRLWQAANWVCRGALWREKQNALPQYRLAKSKRQYRQLSVAQRQEANAVFAHPFTDKLKKMQSLFDVSSLLKKPLQDFGKPKLAYAAGILGFIVGTVAEFYSYKLGKTIAEPTGEACSIIYGIVVAYVRMGISAVATMDVASELVDDTYCYYKTRASSVIRGQGAARFGLLLLALTSSLPNMQNQVQTMGTEGFWGYVLSTCAMIAPACVFFWAGDLVFRDYQYSTYGTSFCDSHDRLFSNVGRLKSPYSDVLPQEEAAFLAY